MGNISVNKYKTIVTYALGIFIITKMLGLCAFRKHNYCDFCIVYHRHTIPFALHSLVIY